jgi:hypothetical protein
VAPALDPALLKAMTAPVVERLARRATECREGGEFSPLLANASEAWWELYKCNCARLRVAETPVEVMVSTLALLNGLLEREEAMANDALLPLSDTQVGDVRATIRKARNLGKATLGHLEEAIQINSHMKVQLSTMLDGVTGAMETIPLAVRALQTAEAATAAAAEATAEAPPPLERAAD